MGGFVNGVQWGALFERRASYNAVEERNQLIEQLDARCVELERKYQAAVARANREAAANVRLQREAAEWKAQAELLSQKLSAANLEIDRARLCSRGRMFALREVCDRLAAVAPEDPLANREKAFGLALEHAAKRAGELGLKLIPRGRFDDFDIERP